MQVTTATRSTAAEVRRAQVVAATVEVLAARGYAATSFARIAEHAGLSSTRLISYHFTDKAELMGAVVTDVVGRLSAEMTRRVGAQATPPGQLRAYVEGVVAFTDTQRASMRALLEVVLSGAFPWDPGTDRDVVGHVEAIVLAGQAAGEFRECDARVVATAVQRAVEGLTPLLASQPDLDCAAYGRELAELFARGLRPDASRRA